MIFTGMSEVRIVVPGSLYLPILSLGTQDTPNKLQPSTVSSATSSLFCCSIFLLLLTTLSHWMSIVTTFKETNIMVTQQNIVVNVQSKESFSLPAFEVYEIPAIRIKALRAMRWAYRRHTSVTTEYWHETNSIVAENNIFICSTI